MPGSVFAFLNGFGQQGWADMSIMNIEVLAGGKRYRFQSEAGTSLKDCLLKAGILEGAECGGRGICGKCAVKVRSGTLVPVEGDESFLMTRGDGKVLACQSLIREDVVREDVLPGTPTMMQYKTHADAGSLYNTPPAYGIYICGKVFKWLKKQGGLTAMKAHNEKKAQILYDYLDQSSMFRGTVVPEDRSLMNVPFVTGDRELDARFIREAAGAGFVNLKGHRTVGGMRASIYNAMPISGVKALTEFMQKFEEENR